MVWPTVAGPSGSLRSAWKERSNRSDQRSHCTRFPQTTSTGAATTAAGQTVRPIGCSSSLFQDGGKAPFTLRLHPGLTPLAALVSPYQEGSLPDHAPLCSRLSGPQDAISVRLLQKSLQAAKSLIGPVAVDQMEDGI